jgi:hypothetical protein
MEYDRPPKVDHNTNMAGKGNTGGKGRQPGNQNTKQGGNPNQNQNKFQGKAGVEKLPQQKGNAASQVCNHWKEHGSCKYGTKCRYSHGAGAK